MPDDTMYQENPGASDTPVDASGQNDSEPDTTDQNEDGENETFLVSKSALGGSDPKVGDVCEFKVVRLHDGEAEFEYVKTDKNEDTNPDMEKAKGELDTMAA